MMMPAAADPIIQTANKPQISTIYADSSRFLGVGIKMNAEYITSPK